MTDFSFLTDDNLVEALSMEVAGLLRGLIDRDGGRQSSISAGCRCRSCYRNLDRSCGQGDASRSCWMPRAAVTSAKPAFPASGGTSMPTVRGGHRLAYRSGG